MHPSLYIHIPFCEVKCGYCDFYSVPRGYQEFDLQEAYVEALCREIDERCRGESCIRPNSTLIAGDHKDRPYGAITSIFFGGGTPSLLRTDLLQKILDKLRQYFVWDADTEITMECNPKTIDQDGLAERKALGINRISMGVQSFQDRFLKSLGRIHSADEARRTIEAAQSVGFNKLSFDLMFALPGQSFEDWQQDLETALSLGTSHLSCYNLTIEANTPFEKIYTGPLPSVALAKEGPLPSDETALKQFRWTRERLDKAGLPAYEISNFAAPDHECLHNQNYWRYGEYIGFGVSAASFVKNTVGAVRERPAIGGISEPAHNTGASRSAPTGHLFAIRSNNVRDLNKYIAGDTPPEIDPIDKRTAMGEYVMLALRTREGVSEAEFKNEFGVGFQDAFSETLERVGTGTAPLRSLNGHWILTDEGLRIADSVVMDFL